MNPLERFTKYTTGKEPVITVNVIAALALGVIVRATEEWGFAWDEFSLTVAGVIVLTIATALARHGVFSPFTHEQEVDAAKVAPDGGDGA